MRHETIYFYYILSYLDILCKNNGNMANNICEMHKNGGVGLYKVENFYPIDRLGLEKCPKVLYIDYTRNWKRFQKLIWLYRRNAVEAYN